MIDRKTEMLTFDQKTSRNIRAHKRYDELMAIGEHGHYETMFRVIHEECELAARAAKPKPDDAMLDKMVIYAKLLRTRKGWAESIPIHGDSIAADFEMAAQYVEFAIAAINDYMGDASTRKDEGCSGTTVRESGQSSLNSLANQQPVELSDLADMAHTVKAYFDIPKSYAEDEYRYAVDCANMLWEALRSLKRESNNEDLKVAIERIAPLMRCETIAEDLARAASVINWLVIKFNITRIEGNQPGASE